MIIEFIKNSPAGAVGNRKACMEAEANPLINQGIAKVVAPEAEKLIGSDGCFIVVGNAVTAIPTGFVAYACSVRIDGTMIKSITQLVGETPAVIADASWENIALIAGIDYIPFLYPITSITLNGAADSVMLWLQSIYY